MYQILAADYYGGIFRVQGEEGNLERARKMAKQFTEEHPFVCHERDIHIQEEGKFIEYAGPHALEEPPPKGTYRKIYGEKIEPRLRERAGFSGEFHGSDVREIFIEHAAGRFFVDDHAEKLIRELVEEGEIEVLQRAPTTSQAAFAGLSYSRSGYRDLMWGPGTIEHYHYRFLPKANT